MTWEAFRLTSKSPSELLSTLGPHGVDDLMRQALNAVWRDYPPEQRNYQSVRKAAIGMFDRNMKVWSKIKKPTPQSFFADMGPYPSDGYLRQAFVLCWMMLPRAGGRDFKSTLGILRRMFDRNMDTWEEDKGTFSPEPRRPAPAAGRKKSAARKPAARRRRPSRA